MIQITSHDTGTFWIDQAMRLPYPLKFLDLGNTCWILMEFYAGTAPGYCRA